MHRNRIVALRALGLGLCLLAAGPPRATAVPCPGSGAHVQVCVTNPTNNTSATITVSGSYVDNEITCTNREGSYSANFNVSPNSTYCTPPLPSVSGLVTGSFVHRINVPGTGQDQYQKGPVLYSTGTLTTVNWTYFPNVITVNAAGDAGTCTATCTTSCTLRQAINRANALSGGASSPVLIQFTTDVGLIMQSCTNGLQLAGNGYITIDATDSNGKPWIVGDPNATNDLPPRSVDLNNIGFFKIISSNNTILGLHIKNAVTGSQQLSDLITFAVGATGNKLTATKINGGNADAGVDCSGGVCNSNTSDLIEVLGGVSFATPAVTVRKVEGHSGIDKGIKANGTSGFGYAVLQDSWIHNNYRGGVQATFNGHAKLDRNVVEEAGFRWTTDRKQMDSAANGLVANGGDSSTVFSEIQMDGNVSRNNVQHGVAANKEWGKATSQNDYFCGNGLNGFAGTSTGGNQTLAGTGMAAVYNGVPGSGTAGRGVAAVSWATANFGDGSSNLGNNAFSENVNCDFENGKPSSTINATNNQWRGNAAPSLCLASGATVSTSPTQNGADAVMSIDSGTPTIPSNVFLQGQTVRIRGLGFDAIAGNPVAGGCVKGVGDLTTNPPTSCCRRKAKANTCSGLHTPASGSCVEFQRSPSGGGGSNPAAVTSVTPAMVIAQTDTTTCIGDGEQVWVSKRRSNGSLDQKNAPRCTNANPY